MSKAADIAAALASKLSQITIANGFNTDIGLRVFRGNLRFDAEVDVPCIVLIEGNDSVTSEGGTAGVKLQQRYIFEAHDNCDPQHPNDRAHLMLADLKRAIFAGREPGNTKLGGLAQSIQYKGRAIGPRPDGVAQVFAGIEIDVGFAEDLANP